MNTLQKHCIDLSDLQEGLQLSIYAGNENFLYENTDTSLHEARYQIKEGCTYEFGFEHKDEIRLSNFKLECPNHKNIIKTSKRRGYEGTISPNIYVGTLQLQITNTASGKTFDLRLEVQSTKASYRKDYRYMLVQIAEKCTDLILQSSAPVHQSLSVDPSLDSQSLYQRFAFIKAMILSEDFELAIHKIVQQPATAKKNEAVLQDVRSLKRISSKQTRALLQSQQKTPLPQKHTLRNFGVNTIATKIEAYSRIEHVDTNENRFIKHALNSYLFFCQEIVSHAKASHTLKIEAKAVIDSLENYLQQNFFREISRPQTLNLNSPLLQRKSGYREQLKLWLQFDLAAKLIWKGGEDVYSAGKKDIATLYEYWLFFKLLEVIQRVFQVESKSIENLFKSSNKGIDLQLKQGAFKAIDAVYTNGKRPLRITLSYNKSFSNKNKDNREIIGSWTVPMRPDYTLSIWPEGLTTVEAEAQEEIVHIHFDAKYKINNLKEFLDTTELEEGTEQKTLNTEKEQQKKGYYKNADLLKMHAYKDAIKRTGGAYVLYPGTEKKQLQGFHEILPGLGAFAVAPNKSHNETSHLENFLREILYHFQDRASQREHIAYKTYEIIKNGERNRLNEPLPEYINGKKLIPNETYVLVGYYKSDEHLKWIKDNMLYNFRMHSDRGALKINNESLNAKFLLLHTKGDVNPSVLFELHDLEYIVTTKTKLKELGYPSEPSQDLYLTVALKNCETDVLNKYSWSFEKLENYNTGRASAIPFTCSLEEFLNVKT